MEAGNWEEEDHDKPIRQCLLTGVGHSDQLAVLTLLSDRTTCVNFYFPLLQVYSLGYWMLD